MVYGSEAVVPAEVKECSARVSMFDPERNNFLRSFDLDLLDEKRQDAYLKMQHCKALTAKLYNKTVKPRSFQVGDLVLKKVEVSKHVGKLDPKWEGPYKVVKVAKNNAY